MWKKKNIYIYFICILYMLWDNIFSFLFVKKLLHFKFAFKKLNNLGISIPKEVGLIVNWICCANSPGIKSFAHLLAIIYHNNLFYFGHLRLSSESLNWIACGWRCVCVMRVLLIWIGQINKRDEKEEANKVKHNQ